MVLSTFDTVFVDDLILHSRLLFRSAVCCCLELAQSLLQIAAQVMNRATAQLFTLAKQSSTLGSASTALPLKVCQGNPITPAAKNTFNPPHFTSGCVVANSTQPRKSGASIRLPRPDPRIAKTHKLEIDKVGARLNSRFVKLNFCKKRESYGLYHRTHKRHDHNS